MDSGGPKGWTHEPAWETGRTRARGLQKVMWSSHVTYTLACSVGWSCPPELLLAKAEAASIQRVHP